ncbi:adenosylhomocysteinase [Streptomyces sp. NPDC047081]|uniref:adenosylhomocysteinase n=1 Tax=Streptomyces sp. NPDC047081 TaxID=3154706 RepID=UPI0033D1965E
MAAPNSLAEPGSPRNSAIRSVARPPSVAADAFFAGLASRLPRGEVSSLVVTHLLPGQMNFLPALGQVAEVRAVLPKPKSADRRTQDVVADTYRLDPLDRGRFADPEWLARYLDDRADGRPLVLADIGGYFAPALTEVCRVRPGLIRGVVEDTENGLRRYLALPDLACPVYSVARSPLKEPEDRLVGEAIVFSVETLLRRLGEVMPGRQAAVLGFGKIGAGIAAALHARHVRVVVHDRDPIRQAQAVATGYGRAVFQDALFQADLVFSATGSRAIGMEELSCLRDGAFVAGATSADDEFDLACLASLRSGFERDEVIPGVARYTRHGRSFSLLGSGNAVNFLHTSAIGPAIHVIKAEIIAAAARLVAYSHEPGLYEVPHDTRAEIAAAWLDAFQPARASTTLAVAAHGEGDLL